MPSQISRSIPITSVCAFFVAAMAVSVPNNAARAADCLAAPGSSTPQGRHWRYRMDRATHDKCWYLADSNRTAQQATAQNASPTTSSITSPAMSPTTSSVMSPAMSSAPSSQAMPAADHGLSPKESERLYAQFLEWERRANHQGAP